MKSKHPSVLDFWSHIEVKSINNPDSCWVWRGTLNHDGYGLYKSCLARRVAAVIYFHKIVGSITLRKTCPKTCVRREHFFNVGETNKSTENHHKQSSVIKKVLAARTPAYTIRELCSKTGEGIKTVKNVLLESAMYDILADVQRYLANNEPVPIIPDTRRSSFELIQSNSPNLELV